jgi:hypothetical protein
MRVYIDPKTGEPTTPPPGAAVEAAPAVQQRSGEGLVEEPAPGGGVMMDLKGRFKTPLAVTIGPDGRARVEDEPSNAQCAAAGAWRCGDARARRMVVLALATVARAVTVIVVNQDAGGEGFNDPTPVAAVGGNPATTLGAQRLNAFQHAADI